MSEYRMDHVFSVEPVMLGEYFVYMSIHISYNG